jgi:predicted kinase
MSEFIMLVGIPGSGKSTWIKINSSGIFVICPDTIRKNLSGDISSQVDNSLVWSIAKYNTVEHLKSNENVILDATNVNTTNRRNFMKGLPYCHKKAIVFEISPELAIKRIQKDLENHLDRSNAPDGVVY